MSHDVPEVNVENPPDFSTIKALIVNKLPIIFWSFFLSSDLNTLTPGVFQLTALVTEPYRQRIAKLDSQLQLISKTVSFSVDDSAIVPEKEAPYNSHTILGYIKRLPEVNRRMFTHGGQPSTFLASDVEDFVDLITSAYRTRIANLQRNRLDTFNSLYSLLKSFSPVPGPVIHSTSEIITQIETKTQDLIKERNSLWEKLKATAPGSLENVLQQKLINLKNECINKKREQAHIHYDIDFIQNEFVQAISNGLIKDPKTIAIMIGEAFRYVELAAD